tara:strand:+ start:787 stop:1413 length:627 start_codon:yes stop_codon:yes gene_type:complete
MKLEKISIDGKKSEIEALDSIFSSKINNTVVSSVLYKTNANYKGRRAKTKQKNEITGSTSKIYAQKGTGNARHASRKAPIFVGGGVAHGPKGQNNHKIRKLNKSEKIASIKSLLTEKNKLKRLIVMNNFDKQIKKTREMFKIIKSLKLENSLMVFDKNSKENIYKSSRNIPNLKLTDVNHFSAYDIVKFQKLVLTEGSLKEIEKRYSK